MTLEKKDKNISSIILFMTLAMVFYLISDSSSPSYFSGKTMIDVFNDIIDNYIDLLLIVYIFICFQIAGYIELKYKKDFITVSIFSIIFTPIYLLFVNKND